MPLPIEAPRFSSEDYWNLPDGERAELLDGVLYGMTPPGRRHQKIIAGLTQYFLNHIQSHDGACEVYPAPFAVNLTADDLTWVEPDLSVICDASKLSDRGCEGAPDLIVEVVSPSSQRMDYIIKVARYQDAGVREYWIVDVRAGLTTVYDFESGGYAPRQTPFDEAVVSSVLKGCSVTVSELLQ